jgi:hypothetical protein
MLLTVPATSPNHRPVHRHPIPLDW